ncbi:MAG: pyridoxamine 5'-phosphate oxidase family protein [Mycobacterium sp.]|uniref:pyridoxamine 5'-phosphate oxidase family protein n=1 Tax=Mycobacterium sp. TaxID=1785 RepID=UPI001ED0E7E4|nr:pyridoxamine 5'-phosphate oxidase family protein [Mycobacterium sp.]MBW0019767.1 pyridoxamine 5'-phosphate oxidase family protein [Mycobacterium sp.]
MSAKGAKKVDLQRLAAALPDYPSGYLITVDDDYRVHTVAVEPVLREAVIDVGLIGGRTLQNLARHSDVTLLWPPPQPGGYSLIVDGPAQVTESAEGAEGAETIRLAVVPTRALLHRNADSSSAAKGCLHDCVVFSLPA